MFGPGFERQLLMLPLTILSLSVHEFAHAWTAWRLGDDTASREGRLTLNPLSHVDLFGTILLPLLGVPFGWAKSVPVNPVRFRRDVTMSGGMAITASAGPLSNILLSVGGAIALGLAYRFSPAAVAFGSAGDFFLRKFIQLNVGLAIFNMLPVPPLDGSRIVAWLLPTRFRDQWHQLETFSPFILLALFWLGRDLLGAVLGPPVDLVLRILSHLVEAVAR